MGLAELFVIAVGLSMDAFAVSVCKGLSVPKMKLSHALTCGVYFGGFQGLMPLIGYLLGSQFESVIVSIDHWIAFVLLGIIGAKMIKESFENDSCELSADFSWRSMLPMAIATSIDALAIGVSFAFLKVDIWWSVLMIGITTGLFSAGGVYIGNAFGCRYKSKAELVGGAILCIMGVKILVEHTLLS
jgi:putative Mn2+ efflux pump MntP